jgi:hypothetical protein
MKKMTFFLFAFLVIKAGLAQGNFENLVLKLDSVGKDYFKGSPGIAGLTHFSTFGANFVNRNDTSAWGDFWSGWAISRLKDSTSIAYDTNDCAAIPAIGHSGSSVYATAFLSYNPEENKIRFQNVQLGVMGFFITNSTIAYRSMQNGDAFAKKFGGISGNDPDYFRIIIKGWHNGVLVPDSVVYYLADFRDSNNVNDYIVKDWQYVNLGNKFNDSITYRLESSDTGVAGMNTPSYFCIDGILYQPESVSELDKNINIQLYPNPIVEQLNISNTSNEKLNITILNENGQFISRVNLDAHQPIQFDAKNWNTGVYLIRVKSNSSEYFYKMIKE